jgi:hypothetical protein
MKNIQKKLRFCDLGLGFKNSTWFCNLGIASRIRENDGESLEDDGESERGRRWGRRSRVREMNDGEVAVSRVRPVSRERWSIRSILSFQKQSFFITLLILIQKTFFYLFIQATLLHLLLYMVWYKFKLDTFRYNYKTTTAFNFVSDILISDVKSVVHIIFTSVAIGTWCKHHSIKLFTSDIS